MTRKGARPAAARRDRTEMSSADGDVNPRGLEDRLGYHLQRAYRAHLRRFAAVGAAHRIRSSQFSILNVVHRNPSIRQADLAKALGKKDANIVTALDELQRRGLIARMRDPGDGRSRILRLTPTGERLTRELIGRCADLNRELARRFGTRRLDQLIELLERLSRIEH